MSRESDFPIGARTTLEQLERDPHPHLALLRDNEPVSWLPCFGGWFVTGRHEAVTAMLDWETYTVDDPRFSTARVVGPSMLSLDGPEHTRHRSPFVEPFRAGRVKAQMEESITKRAQDLVARFRGAGGADLKSLYAGPLAVEVMSDLLGLEDVEPRALLRWYDDIVESVEAVTAGGDIPDKGAAAFRSLEAAVVGTMSRGSLPSLVKRQGDLSTEEVVSNVAILLFGGIVTSEGSMSTLLHQLLLNPDQLEAVSRDPTLVPNAVEEALRFEPAAAVVDRYATHKTWLGTAAIGAGELVRISLSAPNRDPRLFAEPDRFDVSRPNAVQNLTFARGPHACLGIHLARLEASVALRVILEELPTIEIDEQSTLGATGLIFRGPRAVGARWS